MNQLAQITNPALPTFGTGGSEAAGGILAQIIAGMWFTVMTLGGLAVLVFFISGGVAWITAGGDKAKVEAARDRLINAVIGMAILFASAAFVTFIGPAFGFDLLNLTFPSNL